MPGQCRFLWLIAGILSCSTVFAQGMDSTPAERNLLIMSEMLPGTYDNANQAYFDKRRKLPEADRHARVNTIIIPVEAPAFGDRVFLWTSTVTEGAETRTSRRVVTLGVTEPADAVVMKHYFDVDGRIDPGQLATLKPADLRRTPGCDYFFQRRASAFRGSQVVGACGFEWDGQKVHTENTIEMSEDSLWFIDHKFVDETGKRITGVKSGEPYWLERARQFHCYADLPGVGGGRNEPFERYDGITLHDKGGLHWFETRDEQPRTIGVMLQAVTWHILNEKDSGNFNRNSLVIYTMEKLADGSVKEHGYAFTDPAAERVGINMKWMLVNCSMTPRDQARPEL